MQRKCKAVRAAPSIDCCSRRDRAKEFGSSAWPGANRRIRLCTANLNCHGPSRSSLPHGRAPWPRRAMARVVERRLRLAALQQQLDTAGPWVLQLLTSPGVIAANSEAAPSRAAPSCPWQQKRGVTGSAGGVTRWTAAAPAPREHQRWQRAHPGWTVSGPAAVTPAGSGAALPGCSWAAVTTWLAPPQLGCELHTGPTKPQPQPQRGRAAPRQWPPRHSQQQQQPLPQEQKAQHRLEDEQEQGPRGAPAGRPPGSSWVSAPNLLSLSRVAMAPVIAYQMATDQWGPAVALLAAAAVGGPAAWGGTKG